MISSTSVPINANLTAEINANEMNAISFGIEYNDKDFKLFWISQILKTWRRSIMDRRSKSQNLSAENYNPLWESFYFSDHFFEIQNFEKKSEFWKKK